MAVSFFSEVFQQGRLAARQLRKSPGFTATVLFTLAIGMTAATVIFSLVDAVLLRPLALPEPDRLISLDTLERVSRADDSHGAQGATVRNDTSYPNFFDWRSENKSFSSMAAYTTGGLVLGADANGPARRLDAAEVSAEFFKTLGVMPERGRDFTRADELPGSRTVVLSHDLWKNEFNGDAHILGRSIVLSDVSYTVIGVMPAGFAFPISNLNTAFWINDGKDGEGKNSSMQQRGYNQLSVIGRLRPGVTVAQAKAEMDAIQLGLSQRYADDDAKETAVSVIPQLDDLVADVRTPLRILFAAVACLLLIVCANVAGLTVTRASQRRGELAIRAALGASRRQLLRQMLTESVLLSAAGGVMALALSTLALKALPAALPSNLPRVHAIAMNGQVLGFAVMLAIGTGLLFGVLPAWRASKQDPSQALGEANRSGLASRRHYRLQSVLVVAQTAMGLVLLVGAGLLIRSFDRTLHVDPGFMPRQMLTFRISIPQKRYSFEEQGQFFHQLLARLEALPGVKSATAAFPMPLTQGDINIGFTIAGHPTKPEDEPSARVSLVEPKYFETLKIPLKQGRFFLASEQSETGRPVVIVNEAFAKRFFPGENALGKRITSGLGIGEHPPEREIVGVVGNVKRTALTEEAKPEYYIPFEQAPVATPAVALRVSGDPSHYLKMVREEVAKQDSNLPVYRMQSYADDLARLTAQQRFQTLLLTVFAGIALMLAGLGLYAVLSYMLAQRTPELGLRIALGAPRMHVLQLMLARGVVLASAGLIAGVIAAAGLTRFAAGLLYGVKALDGETFAMMTLVLFGVSTLASLLPAWRASRLDPNQTLRSN
jgi:putative ABC transport system permease protein